MTLLRRERERQGPDDLAGSGSLTLAVPIFGGRQ